MGSSLCYNLFGYYAKLGKFLTIIMYFSFCINPCLFIQKFPEIEYLTIRQESTKVAHDLCIHSALNQGSETATINSYFIFVY